MYNFFQCTRLSEGWFQLKWPFSSWKDIITVMLLKYYGKQGWRSGESTRLPPVWAGFDSRTRWCDIVWVEFVVGSRPYSERLVFGYSGFPLSSKTNISKFQFNLEGHPKHSNYFECSKKEYMCMHKVTPLMEHMWNISP